MKRAAAPILSVRGVAKAGDGRAIISGIDWTIRRGEHWALLGANGAGKTTLLRILAGYDWPSEGTIEVLGKQFGAADIRELRKSIGWVTSSLLHQFRAGETALEIVLSGLEASIGLWREFGAAERERARRALLAVGGRRFMDQRFETLSQGERQRAMIARSLVARPRLLILDEPCAGLDPAAREAFLRDLCRLAARRAAPTLVFVTHHIEEIPPFVKHALAMKHGRTLAFGPIEEICCSEVLSQLFSRSCHVGYMGGRFWLSMS